MELNLGHGAHLARKLLTASAKLHLDEVARISIYYSRRVALANFTWDDGGALADDLLMNSHTPQKRLARLELVKKESLALRQICNEYEHLDKMMGKIMAGQLAMGHSINTKLVCMTDKEAKQLGKNLILALRSKKLPTAGVDQWKVQNKTARELLEKYPPLERTFIVLARDVVKTAPWGLMWRVGIGALLSIVDITTDVIVLYNFYIQSRMQYFR